MKNIERNIYIYSRYFVYMYIYIYNMSKTYIHNNNIIYIKYFK